MQSVLRRAGEDFDPYYMPTAIPNETESDLIQKVADFPEVVKEAGRAYSPSLIANYCFELAKEYNRFYHDFSILREEDASVRQLRLLLSYVVARTLKAGTALLGMEMPERM